MPLTDSQKEISIASADFIKDQLFNILKRSTSIDAKKAFYFMLAVCLLKNKDSVENIAKTFYPSDQQRVIRAIFEKISDFLHGSDSTSKYIRPIIDDRFYLDKSNLPAAKQQTLQEFANFLSNDLKVWMKHSYEKNNIKPQDFMPLFEKFQDLIVEDEPRPSSPTP